MAAQNASEQQRLVTRRLTHTIGDELRSNSMAEEAEIRQRIESWAEALRTKNVDVLMSHYASEIVIYDLAPPLQYKGAVAYRKNWEDWFPTFQGPVGYEISDLNVTTSENVAFCRSLNRITGTRTSGEDANVWVRATVGFRKIAGIWMIIHEHFSVPIDMKTFEGLLGLKP